MDILMPVMDGLTATQALRRLPGCADLPVVVVSAGASEAERRRSLQVGADAFLAKPLNFDELLRHTGELLHLTWRHDPITVDSVAIQGAEAPPGPMVPPPADEVETLYRLARIGNMRSIRQRADQLAAQDVRYRSFAQRLSVLASHFQSRAILELIAQYRQGGAAP
jgi:CheY-like chemotaxis protein